MQHSHEHLQTTLQERDTQRLQGWSQALDASIATLDTQLQRSGEQVAQRQQQICDTLAQTTQAINEQAQTHARDTLAEIARLVATASEAPRAAAEVVAELREKLSDSLVRDTATLEERWLELSTELDGASA